jgi:hypothetical protein
MILFNSFIVAWWAEARKIVVALEVNKKGLRSFHFV